MYELDRHDPGGAQGKQHPLGCARCQQVAEVAVERRFGLVHRPVSVNALLCRGWAFQNGGQGMVDLTSGAAKPYVIFYALWGARVAIGTASEPISFPRTAP